MTPWVFRLLLANLAIFIVTSVEPQVRNLLALYPQFILLRPWGVFTYMFVHGGLGHIFFNMLGLFFFGPRLEAQLGGKYFIRLYVLSGLGGAAFSFLFAPYAGVVGASGAVFGVLLGFAYFWPREPIYIWGVLPIESRWLVGLLAAMALYSGISGTDSGVAHFAHLGGFVAGYGYLRWRKHRYMNQWRPIPTPKSELAKTARRADDREALKRWKAIRLEELHELNRDEVERLLKKLDEGGSGGLSPDERTMLDRFATRQ
jgi:membrane associated rhomboid family serine protease